jgi:DNA-binding NtrC family response regulator
MINNATKGDDNQGSWRNLVIGQSPAIIQICNIIELVASRRCTVLITGESGTGKEVIARALHAASPRSHLPMVAVNCTALPGTLIETELFGHAKGAFTGAYGSRIGRFEQANRSSIFLDEIGDLPLDAQAKLLRVLQEQEFQRVGSSETIRVDCRVVAASNVDLERAIRERRFREDLYYRLNVVPIELPPLRQRREDIPLLIDHFVQKICTAEKLPPKRISNEAVEALQIAEWPGNIRQLEHSVHMALALSGERLLLEKCDFRLQHAPRAGSKRCCEEPLMTLPDTGLDFDEVVGRFELSLLEQALAQAGGNKARAAALLQIKRTTLLAKLKSFEEKGKRAPELDSPSTPQVAADQGRAILVCEQSDPVRSLVCETLKGQGCRVLEADSSRAALDLLDCWRAEIGMVVAGAESPTGGDSLAVRIRARAPDLPTILLADSGTAGQVRYHSRTRVVIRPFQIADLLKAIHELSLQRTPIAEGICA